MRRFYHYPLAALAFLFVSAVIMIIAIRPGSDQPVEAQFRKLRTDLDQIVMILTSHPTISSIQQHSLSNDVIIIHDTAGHVMADLELGLAGAELHRGFKMMNCLYIVRNPGEIIFGFQRSGIEDLYPGGFTVFAFCTTKPTFIVPSIDEFRRQNRGLFGFYQHLGDAWYLKYEEAH